MGEPEDHLLVVSRVTLVPERHSGPLDVLLPGTVLMLFPAGIVEVLVEHDHRIRGQPWADEVEHRPRRGVQVRVDVQERDLAGVLGEELRQGVVEPADDELGAGHLRQRTVDAEGLGWEPGPPGLGQALKGVEPVHILARPGRRDDLQCLPGPDAELQRHPLGRRQSERVFQGGPRARERQCSRHCLVGEPRAGCDSSSFGRGEHVAAGAELHTPDLLDHPVRLAAQPRLHLAAQHRLVPLHDFLDDPDQSDPHRVPQPFEHACPPQFSAGADTPP